MSEKQEALFNMNVHYFKSLFSNSSDVKFANHFFTSDHSNDVISCTIFYSNVMIDSERLAETIIKLEDYFLRQMKMKRMRECFEEDLQFTLVPPTTDKEEIAEKLFSGYVFVLFEHLGALFAFNLQKIPNRQTEETGSEVSYRGPRDGLVEDICTNIALIRKRYKTSTLVNESFELGKRGKTKVSLLYVKDVINNSIVEEVRRKLSSMADVNVVLGTAELEDTLIEHKFSIVPLLDYSGRPDFLVASLDIGRFVILVDGAANAIVGPGNLTHLLSAAEDRHVPYYYVNFEMILRFLGLTVSVLLPGFYISLVSFQLEQLPFPFLATITISRQGLPLSPPLETFLVLTLFELFREAGITLPRAIGQTLAVVGGLIIGDAAIRGGLTSPTMLVVSGVTAVATFTLVNQSLAASVSIMRLWILLLSSILGLFGFFLGIFSIVLYVSRLQSFGVPYLAPISPIFFKDLFTGVFIKPYLLKKKRADILRTKDKTRLEDKG
ncbi:spore germination protein [Bacillus sp. Bva_UNVM-123]|uniref:spore germination protein n=1 Tax=Bacillus sp. Bva_UNVM-123 TaxID=2829798 RepID=UPI00391F09BF